MPQVQTLLYPNKLSQNIQATHVQFFTASTYHVFDNSKWLRWLTKNLDINTEVCKEDIALILSLTNDTKFASAIVVCSPTEQAQWLFSDKRVTWNQLGNLIFFTQNLNITIKPPQKPSIQPNFVLCKLSPTLQMEELCSPLSLEKIGTHTNIYQRTMLHLPPPISNLWTSESDRWRLRTNGSLRRIASS